MATTNEIIEIAQISQYLAANDISKKGLYGGGVDLLLPRKLYMIRKNVERQYDIAPSSSSLIPTSNYLYALCGKYGLAAQSLLGISGGSVAPITPGGGGATNIFPIVVTGSDFESDGITYNNPEIVGQNLMLFVAQFNQEWQFAPAFFSYTATGFIITFPGFDANLYPYIIIQNFNP